ncbi:hypothetical protein Q5752_006477 [Cryptotrichosporon argae]
MSAPKSILRNKHAAVPSRAGPSRLTGSKAAPVAPVGKGKKGSVRVAVKRTRGEEEDDNDEDVNGAEESAADNEDESEGMDVDDETDTDEEIERSKEKKRPQKKKKVTTASDFGATLTSLLTEPARPTKKTRATKPAASSVPAPAPVSAPASSTANPILSLSARPLPPSAAAESLERRAARQLKAEKADRLDRARVRDVMEGWAPAAGDVGAQEFERGLRKVAQRGVIKLFNAILTASRQTEEAAAALPLSARAGLKPEARKNKKERDNVLGRGARDELTKEGFLDLVRSGGK